MANQLFELSQLEELAGGDTDFVMSMIDTFLEHTPQQLSELKDNLSGGNLEQAGKLAHKIKPNIDLFGISDLTQDIRDVEQMGKAGEDSPELQEKVKKVDEVLNQVFQQLKDYKNG